MKAFSSTSPWSSLPSLRSLWWLRVKSLILKYVKLIMDHPEFYKQVLNVIYIVEKPYMYWILPQVRLLVIEGTKTWNITLSHRWRLLGEFLKTWVFPSLRSMTWPTTPFSTSKFLDSFYCYFFIFLMFIYLDFFVCSF